jgi:SpoVK/Ycf46/Vps4 family AAA+-type ATPase
VADQIRRRSTVYAAWGFEGRFSLGNGTIALFSGPPGTGKTMAAEVIAGDVGLDLYRVDLASVVSKYIGETEKNLARVFDAAEASNAILLFDEADALFGKRSEVSDAHDRYANVEVAYLLQRVEAYDGTVLLTTNHERNVDEAFLRRIHHRIDFPRPDAAVRERIWRAIFPAETPVGDLDYEFLASFAITGGNIKNVALRAAFLAAADSCVEMPHVVRAVRRELQKEGTLIDPAEFGPYRELL